ncbi:MAG: aromatic ring-hydroxylating dioxygenase subunit alpha [Marinicaulis sp.]|nr:aromatic ring-hydroxylating dioxygenase subunit alpha [Marinicaulis sp.]
MTKFKSDEDVVACVLGHIANNTTDRGAKVWREPVENYRSPERLERELAVIRSGPTPFCPSVALAKPGDYIARQAAQTPLIVVRGQDGKARAFKNACRHRGSELVIGKGCTGAFVCRYHGWSYALDGALLGIPHEDGFPDIDKMANGLAEITVIEQNGIVFVVHQTPDEDQTSAHAMLSGLPQVLKDDQIVFGESEKFIEANWKLFLESFLEGYHIKPAHKETFYPFGYDNLNVIEFCGAHSRVTFPFRRIEQLANVDPKNYDVSDKLTYVTHMFPNVILAELSHHRTLGIIEPLSVSQTKITSYHLTKSTEKAGRDAAIDAAKRDVAFVNETGQQEDIAAVSGIQRSLNSGANDAFNFGHFEPAIVHFHEQLAKRLEAL